MRELDTAKRVLIETIVHDDGSSLVRGKDYDQDGHNYRDKVNAAQAPGQEWETFEEHRDAANNKTWQIYKYYGPTVEQERIVECGWDYSGQPWTRTELTRDGLLRKTWFDNGTRTVKEWNWSGQTWAWRETLYSGSTRLTEWEQYDGQRHIYREWNGGAAFDERETRTNAGGIMYYQHVVTGTQKTVHLWDVDRAQPWAERITTTVNGVIGRIETIYGDHKTVEVRDLTGTEEWTKHIQEWRGPNFKNKVEDKYYDGNKLINKPTWDFNGEDWESEEKRYDDGTVYYHKIVNDDSLTIVTETDTNGSDNWETKITKSREFASTMKTFAVITKYDSAPTESGITFDEFVKLTDHKGVETWFENHIRANNGTPVFGYITDENGNGMSVTYLPGNLEKARAWGGWTLSSSKDPGRGNQDLDVARMPRCAAELRGGDHLR